MYQYLLALSLIAGNDVPVNEECFNSLKISLKKIAVEAEILDIKEAEYVMSHWSNFDFDISLLRERYTEFKNAPLIDNSFRFPDRQYINEAISFNRAYRNNIEMLAECYLHRADECKEIIRETDKIYFAWDAARDAKCDYYYITVRRAALVRLKEMLGDKDYYAGELPPMVPVWRFREIK